MFRKKKTLQKVIVKFDDHMVTKFWKTIDVPYRWEFRLKFAQNPCLLDESKTVRNIFYWRAGFSIEYEFIYI